MPHIFDFVRSTWNVGFCANFRAAYENIVNQRLSCVKDANKLALVSPLLPVYFESTVDRRVYRNIILTYEKGQKFDLYAMIPDSSVIMSLW